VGDSKIIIYKRRTEEFIHVPAMQYDQHYNAEKNQFRFSPIGITQVDASTITTAEVELVSEDIILLMSDGYSEIFPQTSQKEIINENTARQVWQIDTSDIKNILKSEFAKTLSPTAEQIVTAIHEWATQQILPKREKYKKLYQLFKQQEQSAENLTITDYLQNLQQANQEELYHAIKWFIEQSKTGDGAVIEPDNNTIRDLTYLINRLDDGDDATLQVIIVPNPKLELIRAYVETNKSSMKKVLQKKINKQITSNEFVSLLTQLKIENPTIGEHIMPYTKKEQSTPANIQQGIFAHKNDGKFLVVIDRFVSSSTNDHIMLAMHLMDIYMAKADYDKRKMINFIRFHLASFLQDKAINFHQETLIHMLAKAHYSNDAERESAKELIRLLKT
ncbi:MAG: hypothetical protein ACK4PR_06085, partial [Gammaproteobacteria bacterium]